jgi:hypothetical protein
MYFFLEREATCAQWNDRCIERLIDIEGCVLIGGDTRGRCVEADRSVSCARKRVKAERGSTKNWFWRGGRLGWVRITSEEEMRPREIDATPFSWK